MGADLFYTHISGNTYKITFVAYGDCGPASATPFAQLPFARPRICIYDGATSIARVDLRIDTPTTPYRGEEITPVCPADSANTQCTNPSYSIPGIKRFVYTGTYTVPYTSHYWRFIFTGSMGTTSAGRAAAITNIATGSIIQLIDTLDNTYYNNSSPTLTVVPTPFFCLNTANTYNPGAVDPESDSLFFSLVPGADGTNTCGSIGGGVTYTGGYTATNPLGVAAGTFSFSSTTGQLDFNPNITQRSLVVYNVAEYRNDTFIGSSQREMTFLVITCSNTPPTGSFTGGTGGTVVDSATFGVCVGSDSISAEITATIADTTKRIFVTYSGLPPGATFTVVDDSTNHPVCTLRWVTATVPAGTYTFFVTYTDDNCPLSGRRTNAYRIVIADNPTVDAGRNVAICEGNTATLAATGATSYVWSPGTGLSCISCSSPIATPTATTLYSVVGTSLYGCEGSDTVRITVNPNPAPIAGLDSLCVGSSTTLSTTSTGGTWGTSASTVASVSTAGIVTGIGGGTTIITYSFPTGCADSFLFRVNPMPGAIGGPTTVCVGATITLTNSVAGGAWVTSDATIASVGATGIVYGVAAGTATITYTLRGNCYVTRSITVNPLPADITGAGTICAGNTITLADATTGGGWTSSATTVASISSTGVVTGTGAGTAIITYALPTTCFDTALIFVNPTPTVSGPTSVCVGSTITLSSTISGGSWSTTDGSISSVDGSGVVTGIATGTITISYTLPTGCFGIRNITINPLPATISGPSTVCERATITLTNTSSGGSWSSAASTTASVNASTGVVTGVSAGTVNMTYTLPTGCYTTTSITVLPLPVVGTISGATSLCVAATITLSSTVTGGTWSSSSTTLASVSTSGVVYGISAGVDTIIYSVSNSCGTARATYVINVLALPVAGTVSGRDSLCVNTSIVLTSSISGGSWSTSAPAIASVSSTGTVNGISAGIANIVYTITNICGSATTSKRITVLALPTITITPPAPDYCIGNNVSLVAAGAVTYSWSPATDLSTTIGSFVVASPTTTVTYAVTGTDRNGCINVENVTVTVHPLPIISVADITICEGFSGTLTASGATNYTWSPSATLNTSLGSTVTAFPTTSTTYTVIGVDAFGCVSSTTVRVTVNIIPPPPNVVSPLTYCKFVTPPALTATGVGLLWYATPTPGTGLSAAPVPATDVTGSFIWYVSQTVDGCESPLQPLVINVLENAIADFDFNIKYGCTRDTVEFTNRSQFAYAYTWNFGDGNPLLSTAVNPVHYYPTVYRPTTYSVKLVAFNEFCFSDSMLKNVVLQPTPQIFNLYNVTADQTVLFGNSIQLNASGASIYYWTPNDGTLNDPNISNPIARPFDSITYTVYGYNADGCYDSAKVHINVSHDVNDFIPSAFTPNGDGKNDVFRITNAKYGKLVEMSVFNRWGERIFNSANTNNGWDGTFNGVPQDLGVYNYLIILSNSDGSNKTYKGTVTLIR